MQEMFVQKSDIIGGEFSKDIEKFSGINAKLSELLIEYSEIFGELPPPSKGQTLVQMDIKLKKEFEHCNIRTKCWNMPR